MLPSAETVEKANTILDILWASGVSLGVGAGVIVVVFVAAFIIRRTKRLNQGESDG